MKFVTLKPQYVLRGWCNLKYGVLDIQCHSAKEKVKPLTEIQFSALQLAVSGSIAIDDSLFPKAYRIMAERGIAEGFLEECSAGKKLEEYQKYRVSEARYTHTLLWSITGNCNLRCKHCYISSGDNCYGELDFDKCLEAMDQMLQANIHMVALTGGEPLVRRDFWKIVDALLERHINIMQIFTNGMLINEKFLQEFEKRDINPNYFLISFDGVGCHDWLRGVKGSEQRAIEAIKLLKRHGYSLIVTTSLHMGNIHSLIPTYELMKKLKVDFWKAVPIIDTGNWKKQDCHDISIDKIYQEYLKLLKYYRNDNAPMQLGLGGFFQCIENKLDSWQSPAVSGCATDKRCSESLCEFVRLFPYLLPDGRVLPCIAMSGSEMENIAPNIFEDGQSLEKALSSSPIDTYTNYTYQDLFEHNPECKTCEHRFKCSGCRANALANGGFFKKDPLSCAFLKGGYEKKIQEIMAGHTEEY